jgi:hypothetical protein
MRGPWLSGAVGSAATLERLAQIVKARPPAVVLSALWLAEALASQAPVLALVEPERAKTARRAAKKAIQDGRPLLTVLAGEQVPMRPGVVGTLVVEGLLDVDEAEAPGFVAGLAGALRPDGVLVALDGTKDPRLEARLAGTFLATGLQGLAQERPREGAVLTVGRAPPEGVLAALAEG